MHSLPHPPIAQDLLVTALLAFLWLVSSCAWAVALGDVKAATEPGAVLAQVAACQAGGVGRCRALSSAHTAGLNTSVVSFLLSHWSVGFLVPPLAPSALISPKPHPTLSPAPFLPGHAPSVSGSAPPFLAPLPTLIS